MANNKVEVDIINIRDFAKDAQKTTDDRPFGGGPGMVMKVEPIADALKAVKAGLSETDTVKVLSLQLKESCTPKKQHVV